MEKNLIPEEEIPPEPWYKGPIKIIMALFLILLLILWLIPHYAISRNPEPSTIPTLQEVSIPVITVPNISSTDIRAYIQLTPELKQLADQVVSRSCSETHRLCNAKALFYFVQKNFHYLNDPLAFEYYKTPQESLRSATGDCDDASILLASLLRAIGIETRFVLVPRHVFVQAKLPEAIFSDKDEQDWVTLDATCRDCGFGELHYQYASLSRRYLE